MSMNDEGKMSATYLLARAAQCRRMALQARSGGIANELKRLADDYDKDAALQEEFDPDRAKVIFR